LDINEWQQSRISKIITKKLFCNLFEKKISILGFSFKANTNDTRESPAIQICSDLLEEGARLSIYDPKVNLNQIFKDLNTYKNNNVEKAKTIDESISNADAVVILTEWKIFKTLDWENLYNSMRKPAWLFDTRGIIEFDSLKKSKIKYWRVGFSNN